MNLFELFVKIGVDDQASDKLKDLGVDYVSIGALTHSAPILDLSLKNLRAIV